MCRDCGQVPRLLCNLELVERFGDVELGEYGGSVDLKHLVLERPAWVSRAFDGFVERLRVAREAHSKPGWSLEVWLVRLGHHHRIGQPVRRARVLVQLEIAVLVEFSC